MLPRQRRKEKAGAGAPLGLGEPATNLSLGVV